MRGKLLLASMLILFAALIFSQEASAVGIGDYSGRLNYVVDFSPGLKETFSFFLVSNAPSIMDYKASIEGGLKEHFTLSDTLFEGVWPGQTRPFTVTLQLPKQKIAPGLHENSVCVVDSTGEGGGGISIRTRACSIINVRALYPEKYARIVGFEIPNADVGDIININIEVKSWTESDIGSVKARVDVYGPSEKGFDRKIATVETEEKPLASNEQTTLYASLNTRNFESGEYNAVATAYYDGNNASASARFKIGILAVKVINYTTEFVRNKVNKFNTDVESRWNSPIENVYANIILQNETLTTPTTTLKPWETATLTAYWDTTNKKAQYYDGKLILYFAGNSTEQNIKIKVLVNPEEIKRLMAYAAATAIMVALIVIIVLISLKKPTGKNAEKKKTRKK